MIGVIHSTFVIIGKLTNAQPTVEKYHIEAEYSTGNEVKISSSETYDYATIDTTLSVTASVTNSSTFTERSFAISNCTGSGGTSPYSYAYNYKLLSDSGWTVGADYSATTSYSQVVNSDGNYLVDVMCQDSNNIISHYYYIIEVKLQVVEGT